LRGNTGIPVNYELAERKSMNPIFPLISVVLVFTLIPAIYGGYIKLASKLLHYQGVTWKQGFIFGLIVVICSALIRALLLLFSHSLMPPLLGLLMGLLANWLIGSWIFSRQVSSNQKEKLGWNRAANLVGTAVLMLALTVVLLVAVPKMFFHMTTYKSWELGSK